MGPLPSPAGLGLTVTMSGPAHAVPIRLDYPLTGTTQLQGTGRIWHSVRAYSR